MDSSGQNGILITVLAVIAIAGWATYLFDWDPLGIDREMPEPTLPEWWYRTILVTNENGHLNAYPNEVTMGKKDKVRWKNPSQMPFRIEFKNEESPFTESKFPDEVANTYQRPKEDVPLGTYKYSVIFERDTLDPVLDIEEEPPPGGDSAEVKSGG